MQWYDLKRDINMQIKSKRLLKLLTLHADTTSSGSEFHSLTNLFTKKCFRRSYLHNWDTNLYLWPLVSYRFLTQIYTCLLYTSDAADE